jgi:hypothetical protein
MEFILALVSGATLGCLHAFDIDHVVAVSTFAGKRSNKWEAGRMGAMWGLGHTVVLLVLGGILIVFRLSIPVMIQQWSEVLVGILLIVLGAWAIRDVLREKNVHIHKHTHQGQEHIHFHSHAGAKHHTHNHAHSLFALGALHGFAGTGPVVVIIPVAFATSWIPGITFLAVFGLGSMMAMAIFSLLLSSAVSQVRSARVLTITRGIAGCASLIVGIVWITERFI